MQPRAFRSFFRGGLLTGGRPGSGFRLGSRSGSGVSKVRGEAGAKDPSHLASEKKIVARKTCAVLRWWRVTFGWRVHWFSGEGGLGVILANPVLLDRVGLGTSA